MPYVLETLLQRPSQRYVTRMLTGPGAGTEIRVQLSAVAARETTVQVEFNLPIADIGSRQQPASVRIGREGKPVL